MRKRQVQIVVLCEDGEHESFACGYLSARGYEREKLRILKSRKGLGSGKQFVQQQYVVEAGSIRRYCQMNPHGTCGLVALIDVDERTTEAVYEDLDTRLAKAQLDPRGPDDPFAVFVPKWNIDTWVHYLMHTPPDIDETINYEDKRVVAHPDYRTAGGKFSSYAPTDKCPPSLIRGCAERARTPSE